MPRLQNVAMHKLIQMSLLHREYISPHWLRYAYKHSMSGSTLRQMVIDHLVFVGGVSVRAEMEMVPLELFYDMMDVMNDNLYDITDGDDEDIEEQGENGDTTNVANVPGDQALKVTGKEMRIFRTITYKLDRKWAEYNVPEIV